MFSPGHKNKQTKNLFRIKIYDYFYPLFTRCPLSMYTYVVVCYSKMDLIDLWVEKSAKLQAKNTPNWLTQNVPWLYYWKDPMYFLELVLVRSFKMRIFFEKYFSWAKCFFSVTDIRRSTYTDRTEFSLYVLELTKINLFSYTKHWR